MLTYLGALEAFFTLGATVLAVSAMSNLVSQQVHRVQQSDGVIYGTRGRAGGDCVRYDKGMG